MRKPLTSIALLVLVILFAGCEGSPTDPGGSGGQFLNDEQLEADLFFRINSARADHGIATLELDPAVSNVARGHSRAMRDQLFFGHVEPDGSTPDERLRRAGVPFSLVGENVVQVDDRVGDPCAEAHRQFMLSPPHRQNVLGDEWLVAGVGVARGNGVYYFTELFVRP